MSPNAAMTVNSTMWAAGGYAPGLSPIMYSSNGGLSWYGWGPSWIPRYSASLVITPSSITGYAAVPNLMLSYGRLYDRCEDQPTATVFSPYLSGVGTTFSTPWPRAAAASTYWMPTYGGATGASVLVGGTQCGVDWYGDVTVWASTGTYRDANTPFIKRSSAGLTAFRQRSIIMLAGGSNGGDPSNQLNDVWVGVEQLNSFLPMWIRKPNAPWSGATTLVSTSNDYLFATQCGTWGPISNDVWMSADGAETWVRVAQGDAFPARTGASLVAIGRQLFLFGGQNSSTTFTDAWTAWAP